MFKSIEHMKKGLRIMFKKLNIQLLIIVSGSSVVLVACLLLSMKSTPVPTPTPPRWIVEWLEHPSCLPPCWETIQPSVTSVDAIKDIEQRYPDMSVEIKPGTSVIQVISLHLSYYGKLPIRLLISKFGQPDYVRIAQSDPNGKCPTDVIFIDEGMVVEVYPENMDGYLNPIVEISAETNVLVIDFLETGLNSYYDYYYNGMNVSLSPWKGYSEYFNP